MDFEQGQPILGIKDTVLISGYAYPTTQEAYDSAHEKLLAAGYTEKPQDPNRPTDYSFYALEEINAAECGSCNSIISTFGVAVHNHRCESCDEPTTLEYNKGGAIKFRFMTEKEYIGNPISFKIFEYRELKEGDWNELILYAAPLLEDYHNDDFPGYHRLGWGDVNTEAEAHNILQEASRHGLYRRSTVIDPDTNEDVSVIIVKTHKSRLLKPESVFDTHDILVVKKITDQ